MAVVGTCLLAQPPRRLDWFLVLLGLSVASALGPPQTVGRTKYLNSSIFYKAAIPLLGPVGAVFVSLARETTSKNQPIKRVYNASVSCLLALVGSAAYASMGGVVLATGRFPGAPALLLQMAVAVLSISAANVVFLALILKLANNLTMRGTVRRMGRAFVVGVGAHGAAAYMLTILWAPVGLGPFAVLIAGPALVISERAVQEYVRGWQARQESMAALLDALGVRFPGSKVHDERVRSTAEQIADRLGLKPAEVDLIATAAQLRDIGMLGMPGPSRALDRPLHPTDFAALRGHPEAAAYVLGRITFLRPALDYIATHHERMDGHGYPRGLSGEDIPLGGRVIAVADAYVNLVHPQTDREALTPVAAVAECRRRPDHLDPQVVTVLASVVTRGPHADPPIIETEPVSPQRAARGSLADHGHPGFVMSAVLGR